MCGNWPCNNLVTTFPFLEKKMLEDKFAFEKHFEAGEIVCGSLY